MIAPMPKRSLDRLEHQLTQPCQTSTRRIPSLVDQSSPRKHQSGLPRLPRPAAALGEADGTSYLVAAYVPGGSLEDRLREQGSFPLDEALRISAEIGTGLDALHRSGLVHRDAKPSNLMLYEDGRAAITDFGLAKGPAYTVLTRPGQVMGTLDYLAPELIRGEAATPATDIYALGCVVYECVTGVPPFGGKSLFEIGTAHLNAPPPDPGEIRDGCRRRVPGRSRRRSRRIPCSARRPRRRMRRCCMSPPHGADCPLDHRRQRKSCRPWRESANHIAEQHRHRLPHLPRGRRRVKGRAALGATRETGRRLTPAEARAFPDRQLHAAPLACASVRE